MNHIQLQGKILLAEPFMSDPNFKRSVVFLCEHDSEGSFGFVLNKILDISLSELISDLPDFKAKVYLGGPVQNDTLHFLHNLGDLVEDSLLIGNGIYWGGNFNALKTLIQHELVMPQNVRFFVGYTGWSAGQLTEEIEAGSWVVADMDANYIFKNQPQELWQQVLENKGNNFAVIAQMPDYWYDN
ncbi:MAG: YqgE/AlgH family protein [Saprospiraceae bacterium]